MIEKIKFFDAFSGYGGFHLGIERAYERYNADRSQDGKSKENTPINKGSRFQPTPGKDAGAQKRSIGQCSDIIADQRPLCVGWSETDKYAQAVYKHHFGGKNYGDITKINPKELPDFDLFCGGFHCQAFSIAGLRRGFDDTRGTLFFDIARILREKQPGLFLLENVKGLLSHDGGRTFKTIVSTLTELGYDIQWQVLNSKNFGVPQNRERVFIIGHLGGFGGRQVFPIRESNKNNLVQLNDTTFSGKRLYSKEGISPALNTMQGGNRQPKVAHTVRTGGRSSGIDTKQNWDSYEIKGKIRRLTPTECERLMGLPDGWTKYGNFDGEIKEISDSQRYKLCGNGVVVNVVEEIIWRILWEANKQK